MDSFIKYLEEKIEGCELTQAPYRDKIIYQLVLDEYKEQLLLHNVVVPKGTLCDCIDECKSLEVGCGWIGSKK